VKNESLKGKLKKTEEIIQEIYQLIKKNCTDKKYVWFDQGDVIVTGIQNLPEKHDFLSILIPFKNELKLWHILQLKYHIINSDRLPDPYMYIEALHPVSKLKTGWVSFEHFDEKILKINLITFKQIEKDLLAFLNFYKLKWL